ncbi:hypothetical protein [uncultured Dysgonomonas sp.]|mgnify:CR=1 FL=1|nr:hypothetical protein [uncultured Dysgonomonas sp.]
MGQSVSNDALWEKLKEIDKKLNELSMMQKSPAPNRKKWKINLISGR